MKFTKIVFAVFILGITFFTGAQTVQNNSDQPFIEVTGTKELEIVPDEIYI